ncbi:MAG: hypothetical protein ACI9J3_002361 [Parvicellaceae bacterium]|jgi:hypothetical protein
MRYLIILLLLFPLVGYSQSDQKEFMNLQTKMLVQQKSDHEMVSIFIRGDVNRINGYLKSKGRLVKGQVKNLVLAEVEILDIKFLAKQNFIEGFEFEWGKRTILGDSLLIKNNAIAVHAGQSPLFKGYSGKNVISGVVDTGIAMEHMDFRNADSSTRIMAIWDQTLPIGPLTPSFGYGEAFDSSHVNAGTTTHYDNSGHGSGVAGVMAGNGSHSSKYIGLAPESDIIAVKLDFSGVNLTASVDAFKYIYDLADSYNKPCVINASYGDYLGSHDGLDATALFLDSLINDKPGRLFVAAAGNSGDWGPYHLKHQVSSDTNFTWFVPNPTSSAGNTVFIDLWADTADLSNLNFSIGADHNVTFAHAGHLNFRNIIADGLVGSTIYDSVMSGTNKLADVEIYTELRGGQYNLQIYLPDVDSMDYNYSLVSTGSGTYDLWTAPWLGLEIGPDVVWLSDMVKSGLPTSGTWPSMSSYHLPDSAQSVVSGFQCHPNVVATGHYVQASGYTNYLGAFQLCPELTDSIAMNSSAGPNRQGVVKPDVTSTGRWVLGTYPITKSITVQGGANAWKLSQTGFHLIRSGTSFSSPSVAGIGALLLEKCPTITQQEFISLLKSTSFGDGFSGPVPNNRWGYGKTDAFAVLNATNLSPNVIGDSAFCFGEVTSLSTDSTYDNYNWDGATTSNTIVLDSTSGGFLIVENLNGCKSDTVLYSVVEHPLPAVPFISNLGTGNLLTSNSDSIQWYVDGSAIIGENDTSFIHTGPTFPASIMVEHIDSNGCSSFSDSLMVTSLFENSKLDYSVFPNPATDHLFIESADVIDKITIRDINGKIIRVEIVQKKIHRLLVQGLESGLYTIQIRSGKNVGNSKFQVLR